MSLEERLNLEEEQQSESVTQHTPGSREMNYVVKKADHWEQVRRRQQQQEHQQERKKVYRSTDKIKGKLRLKDPFS